MNDEWPDRLHSELKRTLKNKVPDVALVVLSDE